MIYGEGSYGENGAKQVEISNPVPLLLMINTNPIMNT